ncbi:MAG: protein kinase [Anaerolineae bacterium]|nr:protein kinase [Anaerolineae bacterium]
MEGLSGRNLKGYQLVEQVSSGRFGIVYRAHQTALGRDVAVKVVPAEFASRPSFIRRFEGEAEAVARLEHLFIVPIYDYWRDPGGAYLVTRWMRGGSVGDAIQARGACTPERAASIVNQIALALAVAHNNGTIHGNIKPNNILLDEDGNAYLADFGLFRGLARLEGIPARTFVADEWLDYLAPEQIRHEPVTPQTDLYSLGVTLYEMITGQHPFAGCSDVERMYRHMNDPLPAIGPLAQQTAGDINQIIQLATAKDPANRYDHVLAFAESLQQAVTDEDGAGLELLQVLTRRELDVLQLLTEGMSNQEIADKLVISLSTVKWYNKQVYDKLQVSSRTQAALRARQLKLFGPRETAAVAEVATGEISQALYWPEPENPYKGLRPFGAADRQDFFGREKLVEELLHKMKAQEPAARFLAIVGPSGSGKSSLVRAGLLPAVWAGRLPGSECWFTVEMLPGTHPLEALEIGLTKVATRHAGQLHAHLYRDERGLVRATELVLPDDDSHLLLVVDQFEELFTLVAEEKYRQHFLDLLTTAVGDVHSRVSVVITLRADYYDRPLRYPEFGDLLRKRMVTILPLSAKEMERAICGPAERVGITFDAGLVAQMVSEMSYQPGALPLLQYALTELFEQREGRRLTAAAYQQFGGAVGALAHRADALFTALDERSRQMARQLFLRLVSLGEGTGDTRRRVARVELRALGDDPDLMDEIIDYFARHRLLALDHEPTTRQPTVELAHEALIREWRRLCRWLDVSRDDIRMQRLLARAAGEWRAAGEDPGFLLRDARLAHFEGWAQSTVLSLTRDEQRYLDASVRLRLEQQAAEAERQLREAALERRAVRNLRAVVAVLAAAAIVAAALSLFALDRSRRFQREAAVNHSLVLASKAEEALAAGHTDLALALALEGVNLDEPPPEALLTLKTVALGPGTRSIFQGHDYAINAVALSPDGRLALSGSCDALDAAGDCVEGALALWDVSHAAQDIPDPQWLEGHTNWVNAVAFSPDGKSALSGSADGTLILWDVASGTLVRHFAGHTAGVTSVAFDPVPSADGKQTALSGSEDNTLILWDVTSGQALRRLRGHDGDGGVTVVAFSPTVADPAVAHRAVSGSIKGDVILWDVAHGRAIRRFEGHALRILGVALLPDGQTIISTGEDHYLRLWNRESGKLREELFIGPPFRLVLSPNGTRAIVTVGSEMRVWDVKEWSETQRLMVEYGPNSSSALAVSADGQFVLTGETGGSLRLWNVAVDPAAVARFPTDGTLLTALEVSADGRHLLTGDSADRIILWSVEERSAIRHMQGQGGAVNPGANAISPDGLSALAASGDVMGGTCARGLILWDLQTGEPVYRLEGHRFTPRAVAFSPDGRTALAGSQEWSERCDRSDDGVHGDLILWDLDTGAPLRHFNNVEDVTDVTFSADGTLALTGSARYTTVTLWDVASGQALRRFDGHTGPVFAVAFGPGETTVLSASGDGSVIRWEIASGTIVHRYLGHEAGVYSLDISPDGRTMLSGAEDGGLILWDLASGEVLNRFEGHTAIVPDVAFSPDGKSAFSAGFDGQLIQWAVGDWPLETLLEWISANRYVPELTCEQRAEYRVEPLCTAAPP